MIHSFLQHLTHCSAWALALWLLAGAPSLTRADLVEMVNGDHYSGNVLTVTTNSVAVQSEIQGKITLPREKVARITFRETAKTRSIQPQVPAPAAQLKSNAIAEKVAKLRQPAADTNTLARVQQELLSDANGEATQKFNELARGVLSGSLSTADIRKLAEQTLRDAEKAKKDVGPEGADMFDGYLDILRQFLNEAGTGSPTKP